MGGRGLGDGGPGSGGEGDVWIGGEGGPGGGGLILMANVLPRLLVLAATCDHDPF